MMTLERGFGCLKGQLMKLILMAGMKHIVYLYTISFDIDLSLPLYLGNVKKT